MHVIVAELSAVVAPPPSDGASGVSSQPARSDFVEGLARHQQSGDRCFLLAGPLAREDGADLDDLLKQLEHVQHQVQENGARIDGAVLLQSAEDPVTTNRHGLEDICARLQLSPEAVHLICASDEARAAGEALGMLQIQQIGAN